jgi:RNA polymerase primary sigma factor
VGWRNIEDTELGQAMIECLRERPYLQARDLTKRLQRLGYEVPSTDLVEYLVDPESPFRSEPIRWYLDDDAPLQVVIVDDERKDDDGDEEGGLDLESAPSILHAEGSSTLLGEAWTGPSRWIGPDLRPWQWEAFQSWIDAGERGIVEAITGTGKTVVGAYAAAYVLDFGYKVAVTVPTLDLMDQWIEQLESCIDDVAIGRLGDGFEDSIDEVDVLVSTNQSGSKRNLRADSSETLLIADEVHRLGSPTYSLALEEEMVSRLGLTATLERTNDTGVDDVLLPYFGSIVHSYGYAEALEDDVLAPFRLAFIAAEFTPEEQYEYSELGTEMSRLRYQLQQAGYVRGDGPEVFAAIGALSKDTALDFKARRWAQKFMANLSRRRKLQASATNKINALRTLSPTIAMSTRTLVFTETKDAAAQIASVLNADRITSRSFDSDLAREDRSDLLASFREGDVHVLCSPRVLDEGIDVPQVDVGVIVSASQSRRQMIQRLGRIVRPNENGDPSTLFLMYLKGTREDPEEGGHEGFLEEVLPHAEEIRYFTADTDPRDIAHWYDFGDD